MGNTGSNVILDFKKEILFVKESETMTEKYIKASECEKYFYEHLDDNGMIGAMNAIDEMPAADVQPIRRGQWSEIEDYDGDTHYGCTACGAEFYIEAGTPKDNEYYYCPRCGADMRTE